MAIPQAFVRRGSEWTCSMMYSSIIHRQRTACRACWHSQITTLRVTNGWIRELAKISLLEHRTFLTVTLLREIRIFTGFATTRLRDSSSGRALSNSKRTGRGSRRFGLQAFKNSLHQGGGQSVGCDPARAGNIKTHCFSIEIHQGSAAQPWLKHSIMLERLLEALRAVAHVCAQPTQRLLPVEPKPRFVRVRDSQSHLRVELLLATLDSQLHCLSVAKIPHSSRHLFSIRDDLALNANNDIAWFYTGFL